MAIGSTAGSSAPGSDQSANLIFAGPATGAAAAPSFRSQVVADLPLNIPNGNLFNQGTNDLTALNELGASFKGYTIGNAFPTQGATPTLVSGRNYWHAVYVPKPGLISNISFLVATSGVYTSTGYNGFGLYSINIGTGLATQLTATTSSTTLFAGAIGLNTISFATPVNLQEGVYFVDWMYQVSAVTTPPLLLFASFGGIPNFKFPNNININARLNSQTTLPATQLFSGLSITENVMLLTWLS